ncbi:MAG: prohibitin family protein [Bacteroidales bacterium]|nr:prohibitin family protein [Bacteroidales bacterium]
MRGKIGAVLIAIILVLGLVCVIGCLEKVPAGYVGVVYNMNGGVDGEVLTQGWHIVSPTKKVTTYSIGLEQSYLTSEKKGDSPHDESFSIPTSDGKTVTVNLEFSYRFDENRVAETFVMFKGKSGETIKDTFIKPKVVAWTQEVSANYPVTDIFGDKRTAINAELDVYLREKFDQYGIIIDTVNFTNISVDEETAAAIQKKVTAQQELELATIEAQTAQIQAQKEKDVARIAAEKDKEVAQIEAEKALIEANAEAEVVRIAAEAEAEANQKIAQSLTSELIDKIKYERWNGELPTVSGASALVSVEP